VGSVGIGRVLLDTHTLIWAVAEPERLSARAREVLEDQATDLFVSAASVWELATKHRLGKLANGGFVLNALPERMSAADMTELPVSIEHARLAGELDWEHRDPFDRMLAAQSLIESAPIVTRDVRLHQREGLRTVW
jgi:PIN domain nuclease of toxin-antitoxin system